MRERSFFRLSVLARSDAVEDIDTFEVCLTLWFHQQNLVVSVVESIGKWETSAAKASEREPKSLIADDKAATQNLAKLI